MADSIRDIHDRIKVMFADGATADDPLRLILDEEGPEALIDAVLTARNEVALPEHATDTLTALRTYAGGGERCGRIAAGHAADLIEAHQGKPTDEPTEADPPTDADLDAIASSRHAWRLSTMDHPGLSAEDIVAEIRRLRAQLDARQIVLDQNHPVRFTPGIFIDGQQRPVHELETTSAQAAIDTAIGAERLGLGWVIVAYHSAEVDDVSQREYRVIAWRQLTSEVGPIPSPEEPTDG